MASRWDAEIFFAEVIRKLPLDPPLSGKVHYDVLVDSLWYGIDNLECGKVAVLWTQASKIAINKSDDFKVILSCFEKLSDGLPSTEYTVGEPVSLTVVIVGVA